MAAGGFDLIVCDASFISLTLLLPQSLHDADEERHVH